MTKAAPDPITVEIVSHALLAAAEEMKINLIRTAYNPIIYEVVDFSVGLFDRDGNIISQATGLPFFLGNLGQSIRVVSDDIGGRDGFHPGDVYLINDPYSAGTHVNDVDVISPIFAGDEELIGFTATRAHWLDMGGAATGGWVSSNTSIYQEGIRLKSVQLYDRGKLNDGLIRVLRDNLRVSESILGDLRAQVAACHTGEQRFRHVLGRFGQDTVGRCIREMFRQSETLTRQAIAEIPDGTYTAEAFMDDDGLGEGKPPVKATVTIAGDEMIVDLEGSSPILRGSMNAGRGATVAACRVALKCITAPFAPVTEGSFIPLTVKIPENCMFNAKHPAPTGVYACILMTLCDVIFRALADAMPEKVPAAHYADVCGYYIFGTDPFTDRPYVHLEAQGGGWGASSRGDGESMLVGICDGDTRNIPVEVIESKFPLLTERYELRRDSGGPGKYRGGLGQCRDYRPLKHSPSMHGVFERSRCRPWGLAGGKSGEGNTVIVNPGSPQEKRLQKFTDLPVKEDDLISLRTGGGGGWGDPYDRDSELVRLDAARGYISVKSAREDYGVVLDPLTFEIDQTKTRKLRSKRQT